MTTTNMSCSNVTKLFLPPVFDKPTVSFLKGLPFQSLSLTKTRFLCDGVTGEYFLNVILPLL